MQFKKIILVCNPLQPRAAEVARGLADFLQTQKCACSIVSDYRQVNAKNIADLCISLGGDGTTLRCARQTAPLHIPVLSVNCGSLGFLAACEAADAPAFLKQILGGKFQLSRQALLQADILRQGQEPVTGLLAFNDCVIKAVQPRAFTLSVGRNHTDLKNFYGDGIIVATPAGSTAYSLAAGGPIVEPDLPVWTLAPICPHSLTERPLVLRADQELSFTPSFKHDTERATVSLDGQHTFELAAGDRVLLRRSPDDAQLIYAEQADFFERLRRKLEWGKR